MTDTNPRLPVIYTDSTPDCKNGDNIYSENDISSIDTYTDSEKSISPKARNNKTFLYHAFAVSLSLLALFSLFLCLFSESYSIIDSDKIISYIATDFLGIDMDSNKNIYEIIMSGSFGGTLSNNNNEGNISPPFTEDQDTSNIGIPSGPDEKDKENNDASNPSISVPPADVEIPEGEHAIVATDLSKDKITVSNQTDYNIDIEEFLSSGKTQEAYKFEINESMTIDPLVLIIHTHGTEAFTEEGRISYSETDDLSRCEDTSKNIVAIGAEMAKILNQNGIPTIHCPIMHDKDSYKNSYQRAAQTIEEYLKKYPSIKYVFDVHRDSVISESKTKYKPLTIIDNTPTAQIMFVIGSDQSTPEHTNWRSNMTFALKLTDQINSDYSNMTRPLSLRASDYNQRYTPGSILIEIGSCGNTLEEAKAAARITSQSISKLISEGW